MRLPENGVSNSIGNNIMLSIIILAKNEEKNIEIFLKKNFWADETIVVDNDSTDHTADIAKRNRAVVLSIQGRDFSRLRNEAAIQAKSDWLLYIDIDEEVTESLKKEILNTVQTFNKEKNAHAYILKRKNYYLNHLWPFDDGMIRLIYKPSLINWEGKLHETAKIDGSIQTLKNALIHKTHRTLEEMVDKTNEWSELEATFRFQSNHPQIVAWRLFRVMVTGFYDSYIKQHGWKAGTVGVIESMYQAFSMFVTYAKLWEMQEKSSKS